MSDRKLIKKEQQSEQKADAAGVRFFSVVAALIVNQKGEILLSLRKKDKSYPDMWEFPGGKVEKGENETQALRRELKEELNINTQLNEFELLFSFKNDNPNFSLYKCSKWEGEPEALESQKIKWTNINELKKLKMPPYDEKLKATVYEEINKKYISPKYV